MRKLNPRLQYITDKIISDYKYCKSTWFPEWDPEHIHNYAYVPMRWNNVPYKDRIYDILLTASNKNFNYLPHWMTLKQAYKLKGSISEREKERGVEIFYSDKHLLNKFKKNETLIIEQSEPIKSYFLFNVRQIDGLPPRFYKVSENPLLHKPKKIDRVDSFFAKCNVDIRTGTYPHYNENGNFIEIPPLEWFSRTADYYSVLAHVMAHWTIDKAGITGYEQESSSKYNFIPRVYIAELASAFLLSDLGISFTPSRNYANYMKNHCDFQNNVDVIFKSAGYAQKVVDYLHHIQKPTVF